MKKAPFYRIVAADSRSPRDGRFIEILGRYNPRTNPSTIEMDVEKVKGWIAKGAQPSEVVQKLLAIAENPQVEAPAAPARPSKKAAAKAAVATEKAAEPAAPAAAAEAAEAAAPEEPAAEDAPVEEEPAAEDTPVEEEPAAEDASDKADAEPASDDESA